MTSQPYIVSWGVVGCGWISSEFVKDLCLSRPEVSDVAHSIAAVASRDKAKADKFIADFCPSGAAGQVGEVEGVGSYEAVYTHPKVDIVYIGTVNPSHFADSKAALEAGKHVLVEKPACLNGAEWAELSKLAKQKERFLMEGLWTRFQPLAYELEKKLFEEKVIGDVQAVHSDFSMSFFNHVPETHRTVALEHAGGPLLDLGAYILLPALTALYHNPANAETYPDKVVVSMLKASTGVDLTTSFSLQFPKLGAMASCTASFAYDSPKDERCQILGTKGEIIIHEGLSRYQTMSIKLRKNPNQWTPMPEWEAPVKVDKSFPGFGLYWEADEVARSLRDGLLECPRMPHSESALILKLIDEARRQGGYELPKGLEQVV